MTPQAFVDSLNMQLMPQMGYVWANGWRWPVYDWDNHDHKDFESKNYIKAQVKRIGKEKYE